MYFFMYKYTIMTKTWPTIYQYIAPVHRGIWRVGIFWFLIILFWYANNPDERTLWGPIMYIVFSLGLCVYYVVSEFLHPRPDDLGVSAPAIAKYWYSGFAAFGMVLSILINGLIFVQSNWRWFALALFATYAVYLLRPRLVA